jgi:RNA polymerase-binding transcription factor DksA
MHPVAINAFRDRLLKRRAQVLTTIGYLQSENRAVEMNTEWKDPLTKRRRTILLDSLSEEYRDEKGNIEAALERILRNNYGLCVTCNRQIDFEWLTAFPTTASCFGCLRRREEQEPGAIRRNQTAARFSKAREEAAS